MTITLSALADLQAPVDVVVHSIEGSIYQVSVTVAGRETRLVGVDGKTIQWRSVAAVREALAGVNVASLRLHQRSAYDEMVGQETGSGSNLLDVTLGVAKEAWTES